MTRIDTQLAREYAQQRAQNEREREERIADALERDPEIGRLMDALRTRFAVSTREMLSNRQNTQILADALKRDVRAMQARIRARLSGLGLPEDALELKYRCDKCRDSGFLGEAGSEMCSCYKLRRVALMRQDANLLNADDQTFEAFDLAAFPEGGQRARAKAAKTLCEKYADGIASGGRLNLILMGESGLGKTFLLNCVAGRAIQRGVPAMAMTAFHMLGAMRDYHFGQTGEDGLLSQMISCELLLIDDLGTEPMLRNITVEYLFMLLNERMNARRHTVIATNLSPEELQARYNERVLSRLMDKQKGEFILMTGTDLRFRGA